MPDSLVYLRKKFCTVTVARVWVTQGTGKVLVSGVERFHGRLDGEILVDLWSITQSSNDSAGMPGEFPAGSNAYPNMSTRSVSAEGREVLTDSEGYLVDPADWTEGFARASAHREGLVPGAEHWEVIRYVRHYYLERGFVRRSRELASALNARFKEQGGSRYLYRLFNGGPVLKACRMAGVPVPENCVDASFGTAF